MIKCEHCNVCKGDGGRFVPGTDITGEFIHDWEDCMYCDRTTDHLHAQPGTEAETQPRKEETRANNPRYGQSAGGSQPPVHGKNGR